jgi:hypothetical protein
MTHEMLEIFKEFEVNGKLFLKKSLDVFAKFSLVSQS